MTLSASIPAAPGAVPLVGHTVSLLRSPLTFMTSLPPDAGVVRLRVSPTEALLVCDADLTRHVLVNDRIFDKGGLLFDRIREILGHGLSSAPHDLHRRHRRLVSPAFQTTRLPGYARVMTEQAAALTRGWHDGRTVDVLADMQALTARVVMGTIFADASVATSLDELIEDFGYVLRGAYRRMLLPPALTRLPVRTRYDRTCDRLRRNLGGIIQDYRAQGVDHGDLLSILVAPDECPAGGDRRALTDTEVTDHLLTFFVGGMETCGSVLAWALHLLALHPGIERQLHAEVDAVLDGEPATYDHLPSLPVATRIVTEVLRLYPPAWIATRITTEATTLGGHPVDAGTTVVISPYLQQRKATLFPAPERFDPDRWAGRETRKPQDDPLFAWAGGARRCIGEGFAMTETVVALATIAARWRLEPVPGSRVRPSVGAVITPSGIRMRAVARHPRSASAA